jgi:hypothetical protein
MVAYHASLNATSPDAHFCLREHYSTQQQISIIKFYLYIDKLYLCIQAAANKDSYFSEVREAPS